MPAINKRNKKLSAKKPYNKQRSNADCNVSATYTNTPFNMAQQILQNALHIGLYIELDDITPGDGNCFYHAIIPATIKET